MSAGAAKLPPLPVVGDVSVADALALRDLPARQQTAIADMLLAAFGLGYEAGLRDVRETPDADDEILTSAESEALDELHGDYLSLFPEARVA